MTIAYFDCFSGISGDMCLGAIVDAGLPLRELEKEQKKFPLTGYRLSDSKVNRGNLRGTEVNVLLKRGSKAYPLKRWKDVRKMIQDSSLSFAIKNKGLSVFRTLFLAEAKVHGRSLHTVHLHELGTVDCMIDVFGTIIGLHLLGSWRAVFASTAINAGGANGLLSGNPRQLAVQAGAMLLIAAYSFAVSMALFKVLDLTMGLRVAKDEEIEGLDISQHGEAGYTH